MSPPTKPWQRLKDLAESRRDTTGRSLAAATAQRDGAQSRLSMLLDYRREYENRLSRAAEEGIDAERLRNYHRFLAQLDQAIEQQASQTADAQTSVDTARETWQGHHREVQSYDALGRRAAEAKAKHERRVEQKQLDEHVATRARHAPPKPKES
jgi:flagellar FliJ protein